MGGPGVSARGDGSVDSAVVLALNAGNSKTDVAVVGLDGTLLPTSSGPGFRSDHEEMTEAVATLAAQVEPVLTQFAGLVDYVAACLPNADLPTSPPAW